LDEKESDMDDASERWLPVVRWEGLYEVSDLGRVRSLDRTVTTHNRWGGLGVRRYRGRVLKPATGPAGRPYVTLHGDLGREENNRLIHDLVTEAFLGPRPPGTEVLHGPGGVADNRLVNLSYDTHLANCDDRARDGKYHFKLTRALAAEIRARHAAGESCKSLAEAYGVHNSTISRIVTGIRWSVTSNRTLPHKSLG
jgi:hypothetical protein